jgi:hypothetical protein
VRVTWVGGHWLLAVGPYRHRVEGDRRWLDAWLAGRGLSRANLDFGGSRALEQRFVSELGPVTSHGHGHP